MYCRYNKSCIIYKIQGDTRFFILLSLFFTDYNYLCICYGFADASVTMLPAINLHLCLRISLRAIPAYNIYKE